MKSLDEKKHLYKCAENINTFMIYFRCDSINNISRIIIKYKLAINNLVNCDAPNSNY